MSQETTPVRKCTCWLGTDATFGSSEARRKCAVHGDTLAGETTPAPDVGRLIERSGSLRKVITHAIDVLYRMPDQVYVQLTETTAQTIREHIEKQVDALAVLQDRETDAAELKRRLNLALGALDEANASITRHGQRAEQAEADLARVTSDRDAKTKRMWELGHELEKAEAEVVSLRQERNEFQRLEREALQLASNAQQERCELVTEVEALRQAAEAAEASLVALREKVERLTAEHARIDERLTPYLQQRDGSYVLMPKAVLMEVLRHV